MRRLYLRIYLAVLASLVVFALVAGALWRFSRRVTDRAATASRSAGVLAQNVLPPADAPPAAQQAALERLAANLRADVGLFGADRARLAAVGERRCPRPTRDRERGGMAAGVGTPAGVDSPARRALAGGARAAGASAARRRRSSCMLGLLALAVGVGAYPGGAAD